MPIGISDEHVELQRSARRWVEQHIPPAVPRALLDAAEEFPPPFAPALQATRWAALHVPEAMGGEGYSLEELAVVLEELGRVCAPGAFLPSALAAAVLSDAGTTFDVVADLATGTAIGA